MAGCTKLTGNFFTVLSCDQLSAHLYCVKIIHNWLNGTRNFTAGCALYKVYGTNEDLKALLLKGDSPFARQRLAAELEAIATGKTEAAVQKVVKEAEEMPETDDAVLQALRNEWLPLYQRMNLLRHEMDKYGDENTDEAIQWRKPRAKEIKELEQQCMAIWAKGDYYQEHGKLPFVVEKKTVIPTDPLELGRLVETTKKNIRRNRDQMAKNPDVAKYVQLYNQYKATFKEITGQDYKEKDA